MDDKAFDEVAREIAGDRIATRRRATGLLLGAIGMVLGAAPETLRAGKRKRKRKRRKPPFRCTPDGAFCPPTTQRDCCNLQCCLAVGEPEGGVRLCTSWLNTCCTAEEGGGACPFEFPFCCLDGGCGASEEECISGLAGDSGAPRVGRGGRE